MINLDAIFFYSLGSEAQGGATYCAVAALYLLDAFDRVMSQERKDALIHWCLSRYSTN